MTHKQFFCRADPELLEVLDFGFIRGGLESRPLTAVVTESVGRKFFGDREIEQVALRGVSTLSCHPCPPFE